MKYKAVIFDLFGTLIENYPASKGRIVMKNIASVLDVPAEEFIRLWRGTYEDRQTGVLASYRECFERILQQMGVNPPEDKMELAVTLRIELTHREVMTQREGAGEALSYLKRNGYKTGLISNCSMETVKLWKETDLASYIDKPVYSCVEGMMKPDHRLFHTASERLGIPAPECIYIGDGMSQELATASEVGMRAMLVDSHHETDYEHDREQWPGEKIASLPELIPLLEQ